MTWRQWVADALERAAAWWRSDLRVVDMDGEQLPARLPRSSLVRLTSGGAEWSAGFLCPCGCGDVIELLLLSSMTPHWTLSVDRLRRPTLSPSVWRTTGCGSHFWLRNGRVEWTKAQHAEL